MPTSRRAVYWLRVDAVLVWLVFVRADTGADVRKPASQRVEAYTRASEKILPAGWLFCALAKGGDFFT